MLAKFDPPLHLRSLLAPPGLPQAFPFDQPGCRLHFSGRYALWAAIQALALPRGAEVLLPSYSCGTEVEPFVRTGLAPRFYRVGGSLACDLEHLEGQLGQGRPRALLLTHYFGLPQPVSEVSELCAAHGVSLIEDCAHALLGEHRGRPLGSWGTLSVFSLIKSLPLPDGAVMLPGAALQGPPPPGEQPAPPSPAVHHLAGKLLRYNHPGTGRLAAGARYLLERTLAARRRLSSRGLPPIDPRAAAFHPEAAGWTMSGLARRILAATDLAEVKAARRRNFAALLGELRRRRPGCLLVTELPEGACPLCLPVRLRRPAALFARSLAGWGVEAVAWWDEFHPAVPWAEFPEAQALKRRVLALPVHQGLSEADMERVACAFEATWRLLG